MHFWPVVAAAFFFASQACAQSGSGSIGAPLPIEPKNIVVILCDDCGVPAFSVYNDLGIGDAVQPAMPEIDALAAAGVRYQRGYATPVCSATRAGFLTGQHMTSHWLDSPVPPPAINAGAGPGNSAEFTFATAIERVRPGVFKFAWLGKSGIGTSVYHCAGGSDEGDACYADSDCTGGTCPVAPWGDDMAWLGFNRFYGHSTPSPEPSHWSWSKTEMNAPSLGAISSTVVTVTDTYASTYAFQQAWAYIQELEAADPNQRWIIVISTSLIHSLIHDPAQPSFPTTCPLATAADCRRAMYEQLNADIAWFRTQMQTGRDRFAEDMIIFVSDNGGEPGSEDGGEVGGKGGVFEGGVHVPFIISGAGVANPGRVEVAPVHIVDLWATILDYAGVSQSDLPTTTLNDPNDRRYNGQARPVDSRSLRGNLAGWCQRSACWPNVKRDYVYSMSNSGSQRMTTDASGYKYMIVADGSEALYAISDETVDLTVGGMNQAEQAAFDKLKADLEAQEAQAQYVSLADATQVNGPPATGGVTGVAYIGNAERADGFPRPMQCQFDCGAGAGWQTASPIILCNYATPNTYQWAGRCSEDRGVTWETVTGQSVISSP